MNEQQADDIFHRLTKCVLTMERVKSSSLNDRSEFCPFTSETGNWPQIDQIFPSLRKEKKENLVNLYTRIPFSIFYSSRPLFPDIHQYFKYHIRNNENFYVPILRQYCNLASPWKMKNLPPSFPFLYHFHDAYYLSTWRGEKREELHHENVTLYSALPLDEAISRPSENVQRMQWSKTIETAGVESDARVSFPL